MGCWEMGYNKMNRLILKDYNQPPVIYFKNLGLDFCKTYISAQIIN